MIAAKFWCSPIARVTVQYAVAHLVLLGVADGWVAGGVHAALAVAQAVHTWWMVRRSQRLAEALRAAAREGAILEMERAHLRLGKVLRELESHRVERRVGASPYFKTSRREAP